MKLITIITTLLLTATAALACNNPVPYPNVVAKIGPTSQHAEHPHSYGVVKNRAQSIIQLWVNPETRTWTLVELLPNGFACTRTWGTDWEEVMPTEEESH